MLLTVLIFVWSFKQIIQKKSDMSQKVSMERGDWSFLNFMNIQQLVA